MTKTTHSYMRQNPVLTGLFAVLAVLAIGTAFGFALNAEAPSAEAQVTTLPPITVVAPPPPPPVVVPVIPVVITPPPPVITTPPYELPPIDVIGDNPNTPDDPFTPPCCTVTPPPEVVPPPVIDNPFTPPCCTVTPPDVVPPPVIPPVIPPVNPPVEDDLACISLTATPHEIDAGDAVTLTWKTRNATSITIDQGVGSVTPVAAGSVVVHPTTNTTYTATVSDGTRSVHCQASVVVTPPSSDLACIALTATPHAIRSGDAVTLAWETRNATSITIDQGVGSVTPVASGSTVVHPTTDTTYTATVSDGTRSVHCQASVVIATNPGPACERLTASATRIDKGDAVTLSWVTSRASSISIDHGVGSVTPVDAGSIVVHPTEDTTYTATVPGAALNAACQVRVEIITDSCSGSCGGGGHHSRKNPKVVLSSSTTPADEPLSYVYLSEIPYTGLELGPVGTALYWLMLALWSAAAAYLVLFNAFPFALRRVKGFGGAVKQELNSGHAAPHPETIATHHEPAAHVMPVAVSHAPAHESHAAPEAPSAFRGFTDGEGFRSFASAGTLTIDDIVKGLARESVPIDPVTDIDQRPAYAAMSDHGVMESSAAPAHEEAPAPRESYAAPVKEKAPEMHLSTDVRDFIDALLKGERDAVFGMIRQITRMGGEAEHFLAGAVCALDDAYRARIDGSDVHPEIAHLTKDCGTPFLERLVASLSTGIDASYSTGITGTKLAVTRALSVVNG